MFFILRRWHRPRIVNTALIRLILASNYLKSRDSFSGWIWMRNVLFCWVIANCVIWTGPLFTIPCDQNHVRLWKATRLCGTYPKQVTLSGNTIYIEGHLLLTDIIYMKEGWFRVSELDFKPLQVFLKLRRSKILTKKKLFNSVRSNTGTRRLNFWSTKTLWTLFAIISEVASI